MTHDLGAAFAELDPRSRHAICDYVDRFPNCLAAAVGAAMDRGVQAGDVEGVVNVMSPTRRGRLYVDARRQEQLAEKRGAASRAAFYAALAALADRKQLSAL